MTTSQRTLHRPLLLIFALLLAAPAWAQKVPTEELGDAEKYAAGHGQPDPRQGPVPANDDCENAEAATVPSTIFGTTIDANFDEPPAFTCGTTITAEGVWYSVTGNGNSFTATTCNPGTDYDTKISVFCEDCADLTCVDGNDDGGSGVPQFCSELTWCTEEGAEYSILVHGFGAATGNFELDITNDGVPCAGGVSCLPKGACCDGLGGCSIETEAACNAAGSFYLGDDTQCFFPDGAPTTYAATPGVPIPDNDPAGITSVINVPDSFIIADVDVDLTITHTFIDDLIVTLTHPDGVTTATLWNRGCAGEDNMDVTIDDEAPDVVCAEPTVGSLNPLSVGGTVLSAFDGLDAAGDWTLSVSDNVALDTGTLDAWSLSIDSGTEVCFPHDPCAPGHTSHGGNFCIPNIPTLDHDGLALLVLLLASGAVVLIRRRA